MHWRALRHSKGKRTVAMQAIHLQGSTNNVKSFILKDLRRCQKCRLQGSQNNVKSFSYKSWPWRKHNYTKRCTMLDYYLISCDWILLSRVWEIIWVITPWLLDIKALMRGQRNDFQQKNDWQLFISWENHGSMKSVRPEFTHRFIIQAKHRFVVHLTRCFMKACFRVFWWDLLMKLTEIMFPMSN